MDTADPPKLATRADMLSMSGLEMMQALLEGRFAPAPISVPLNFTLHSVAEGRVMFRGTPDASMMNPMGTVHGGWYGTLLDSAMGCAVATRTPKGSLHTTLEYKVNIIRPIQPGTLIDCEGIADHAGRSTGVAHGALRGVADGRLYATGSTTCLIMQVASPADPA